LLASNCIPGAPLMGDWFRGSGPSWIIDSSGPCDSHLNGRGASNGAIWGTQVCSHCGRERGTGSLPFLRLSSRRPRAGYKGRFRIKSAFEFTRALGILNSPSKNVRGTIAARTLQGANCERSLCGGGGGAAGGWGRGGGNGECKRRFPWTDSEKPRGGP